MEELSLAWKGHKHSYKTRCSEVSPIDGFVCVLASKILWEVVSGDNKEHLPSPVKYPRKIRVLMAPPEAIILHQWIPIPKPQLP